MKKKLNITTLFVVLLIAGCQKDIQQTTPENISEEVMAKSPSVGNTTVNLSVEVDDTPGNKILSDEGGLYFNGTDRVQAQILSSDGNFFMNTNNNTARPEIRFMHFPFGGAEVDLEGKRNYSLRTMATTPLQNMDPNGGTQLVGFRVWAFEQGGVIAQKLIYRMGIEVGDSETDYAKVTRNGDVWTIEPAGYTGVTPANATLANGGSPAVFIGHYVVPFKLILTKIGR